MKNLYLLLLMSLLSYLTTLAQELDSLENIKDNLTGTEKIDVINRLSYLYYSKNPDKTLEYANSALALSEKQNYTFGYGQALNYLSVGYWAKSNYDSALIILEKAKTYNYDNFDSTLYSQANGNMGMVYNELSKYAMALNHYKIAAQYKIHSDLQGKANVKANTAVIYLNLSDYDNALEKLLEVIDIYKEINNPYYSAWAYGVIGSVYKETEQYDLAMKYYRETEMIYLKLNNELGLAQAYNSVGLIFKGLRQKDSAIYYLEKSYKKAIEVKSVQLQTQVLGNLGNAYMENGDFENALKHHNKAYELSLESNNLGNLVVQTANIGSDYLEVGQAEKALPYLLKSKEYAMQVNSAQITQEVLAYLAKAYAGTGDYKNAYETEQLYNAYTDTLNDESSKQKLANMQVKYETEQVETENNNLKTENQLQQETIRNRNIIAIAVSVVLVLIMALVVNLVIARRRMKQANQLLIEQKEEIKTQAEELRTTNEKLLELDNFKQSMTGMIVHDLKNPLNSIINVPKSIPKDNQIQTMQQSGRQMLNMVLNILDVFKYEETKLVIDPKTSSVFTISQTAISEVELIAQQKNITIKNSLPQQVLVDADNEILTRVFVNLLTNAIKYTPVNGSILVSSQQSAVEQQATSN